MSQKSVARAAKLVCTAEAETARESYLEAIGMLSGSSASFVVKLRDDGGKIVRSTIPSLISKLIPLEDLPSDGVDSLNLGKAELGDWTHLPPFEDGRLNSIIARRFESNGTSFYACAASSSPERFSDEVAENFGWTVTLGEFTLKVLREKELSDKKDKDTQNLISTMKKEVVEAQKATDQLEGANAQLANALLDVSSAKAQSKAILATVGIGIILFAISEFRIEPWLEQSGVSPTVLVYQKVAILGGLVPIQVLFERFISKKMYSSASKVRVDMYHEVLSVMLEDSTLTARELKWLELYRRQQGVTKDEAQAVEAKIRSELLLKKRSETVKKSLTKNTNIA